MSEDEDVELLMDENWEKFQQPVYREFIGSPLTNLTASEANRNRRLRTLVRSELETNRTIPFWVYDPADHTPPSSSHSPDEVLQTDHAKLVKSDVYVCIASHPSHGVGIEATWASQASVPRLLVVPKGTAISKLLVATTAYDLGQIEFEDIRDVPPLLRQKLSEVARVVTHAGPIKRRCFEELKDVGRGRFILKRRIELGVSRLDLSRRSLVPESLIAGIELDEVMSLVFGTNHWHMLASVLNARMIQKGNKSCPEFVANESAEENAVRRESLESLTSFVVEERPRRDDRVLQMWKDYAELQSEALVGREPLDEPLSVDDWTQLYADNHDRLI